MATFSVGEKYGIPKSRHFSRPLLYVHTYYYVSGSRNPHEALHGVTAFCLFLLGTLTVLILSRKRGDFV